MGKATKTYLKESYVLYQSKAICIDSSESQKINILKIGRWIERMAVEVGGRNIDDGEYLEGTKKAHHP